MYIHIYIECASGELFLGLSRPRAPHRKLSSNICSLSLQFASIFFPPSSNFVTKIHFDTNISTISALISDSMKGVVEIVKTTNVNIAAVKTLVAKMREETDKKIKSMKKEMQFKMRDRIRKKVKYNKCVRLPYSGGVLDCGPQFTILVPYICM